MVVIMFAWIRAISSFEQVFFPLSMYTWLMPLVVVIVVLWLVTNVFVYLLFVPLVPMGNSSSYNFAVFALL